MSRLQRWCLMLALPVAHICLCLAITFELFGGDSAWLWMLVYILDTPASLLVTGDPVALACFGTLWWFLLSFSGYWAFDLIFLRHAREQETVRQPQQQGHIES